MIKYREGDFQQKGIDSNNDIIVYTLNNIVNLSSWVYHREDGPAIICKGEEKGTVKWYLNGVLLPCSSQKEFERLLKLKVFW